MLKNSLLAMSLLAALFAGLRSESAPAESSQAIAASRAYLGARNLPAHGVALEGYSPVSYFSGRAERGEALFAVEHDGVTYHLTGAEQVKAFKANPKKYEPAFGGWCAFGMAVSDKFPIDPACFQIIDGKIFLFLKNQGVDARDLWNQGKKSELLSKAEMHWKKVQG